MLQQIHSQTQPDAATLNDSKLGGDKKPAKARAPIKQGMREEERKVLAEFFAERKQNSRLRNKLKATESPDIQNKSIGLSNSNSKRRLLTKNKSLKDGIILN